MLISPVNTLISYSTQLQGAICYGNLKIAQNVPPLFAFDTNLEPNYLKISSAAK
jgi:hypothetical protein